MPSLKHEISIAQRARLTEDWPGRFDTCSDDGDAE